MARIWPPLADHRISPATISPSSRDPALVGGVFIEEDRATSAKTAERGRSAMISPTVKVIDLAWGRLRAPNLDAMEEFLTHFGMARSARTDTALYMRGSDSPHHIHVTEKGE